MFCSNIDESACFAMTIIQNLLILGFPEFYIVDNLKQKQKRGEDHSIM